MFNITGCSNGWARDEYYRVDFLGELFESKDSCQIHILSNQIVHSIVAFLNVIPGLICGFVLLRMKYYRTIEKNLSLRIILGIGCFQCLISTVLGISLGFGFISGGVAWVLQSMYFTSFLPLSLSVLKLCYTILSTMVNGIVGKEFSSQLLLTNLEVRILFVSSIIGYVISVIGFCLYTALIAIPNLPSRNGKTYYEIAYCGFGLGTFCLIFEIVVALKLFRNFVVSSVSDLESNNLQESRKRNNEAIMQLAERFRKFEISLKISSVMSSGFFFLNAFLIPEYVLYVLPFHLLNNVLTWIAVVLTFIPELFHVQNSKPSSSSVVGVVIHREDGGGENSNHTIAEVAGNLTATTTKKKNQSSAYPQESSSSNTQISPHFIS